MQNRPAGFAAGSLLLALSLSVAAAPEAILWERWTAHDPASERQVDHSAWDRLLKQHVKPGPDGVNRLDYRAIVAGSRAPLREYLARLAEVPVSTLSRARQRAYWINLYNALTVQVIVDHYPVESIRDVDISPGLFASGPWGKKLIEVEGEALSLDDIEHRVLRPIWRDPRIHYAVNCASIGCPDLMDRAFTSQNTDALLDEGARRYVNHPRGARVTDGRLTVSSIYEWFKADFGGNDRGVIAHLEQFAAPALKSALEGVSAIDDDRYDWSLNDVN